MAYFTKFSYGDAFIMESSQQNTRCVPNFNLSWWLKRKNIKDELVNLFECLLVKFPTSFSGVPQDCALGPLLFVEFKVAVKQCTKVW